MPLKYYRKLKNIVRKFHEQCDRTERIERLLHYGEAARKMHPLVFSKYKNCNAGKEVVLVACGTSTRNYKPIEGAVHVGVNRAFLRKGINFDALFFHDRQVLEEHFDFLKNCSAKKFVAFHTNAGNAKKFNASSKLAGGIGANRFFISDPSVAGVEGGVPEAVNPDIADGMLVDRGGGTVFSALQFVLYTKPRRLYLVGCDCDDKGHFYSDEKNDLFEVVPKLKSLWREAANFVKTMFPEIEIVSINPVELKGLFQYIYTEEVK